MNYLNIDLLLEKAILYRYRTVRIYKKSCTQEKVEYNLRRKAPELLRNHFSIFPASKSISTNHFRHHLANLPSYKRVKDPQVK